MVVFRSEKSWAGPQYDVKVIATCSVISLFGGLSAPAVYTACITAFKAAGTLCSLHTFRGIGSFFQIEESPIVRACKFDAPLYVEASLRETFFPDRVLFKADVAYYSGGLFDLKDTELIIWNPQTQGLTGPDTTFTAPDPAVLACVDVPSVVVDSQPYEAKVIVGCLKNDPAYNTEVLIYARTDSPTQPGFPIAFSERKCSNSDLIASNGVCTLELYGKVAAVDTIKVVLTESFLNLEPKVTEEVVQVGRLLNSVCGRRLTTYYEDADSDGFGNPNVSFEACSAPEEGYVENNLDCDDGNASVNPGATELCNGIDENCDGNIDEGGVCGPTTGQCKLNDGQFGECLPIGECFKEINGMIFPSISVPWQVDDVTPNCRSEPCGTQCCVSDLSPSTYPSTCSSNGKDGTCSTEEDCPSGYEWVPRVEGDPSSFCQGYSENCDDYGCCLEYGRSSCGSDSDCGGDFPLCRYGRCFSSCNSSDPASTECSDRHGLEYFCKDDLCFGCSDPNISCG